MKRRKERRRGMGQAPGILALSEMVESSRPEWTVQGDPVAGITL